MRTWGPYTNQDNQGCDMSWTPDSCTSYVCFHKKRRSEASLITIPLGEQTSDGARGPGPRTNGAVSGSATPGFSELPEMEGALWLQFTLSPAWPDPSCQLVTTLTIYPSDWPVYAVVMCPTRSSVLLSILGTHTIAPPLMSQYPSDAHCIAIALRRIAEVGSLFRRHKLAKPTAH